MTLQALATTIKSWPLYHAYRRSRQPADLRRWLRTGKTGPVPHLAKQAVLRAMHDRYRLPVLVETGTYLGDMVYAMHGVFEQIYSIELSPDLHRRALHRFRRMPAIHLLLGDSGQVLGQLVEKLQRGTVFWLDGHFSGGATAMGGSATPVMQEVSAIMRLTIPFVVLIDDASLFNGSGDYPTLAALAAHAEAIRPGTTLSVADDIISIVPPHLQTTLAPPGAAS